MFTLANVLIGMAVVVVLWLIVVFNGLIRRRVRIREAWSDIEVQLKRRYDLIPNLVETVRGYMGHEKDVFEKVTEARSRALGAGNRNEKSGAEDALSGTLKNLFAVAENYPELKANDNFLELQRELSDTENKIQAARRFYNSVVMDYNTAIGIFPALIFAKMLGFGPEEFFGNLSQAEREPVKVKF